MGISLPEILTQAFGFILLVLVLKKLAWIPLLELLDERRYKIQEGFSQIEQAKKDVEKLKADYEYAKTHIEEEAREKLQQAIDEGTKIARELQETARKEARAVLEKAKENITLEMTKAKVTLRQEIVDLTLGATEKLIREKLDETKDKELVLDFIEELEKLK